MNSREQHLRMQALRLEAKLLGAYALINRVSDVLCATAFDVGRGVDLAPFFASVAMGEVAEPPRIIAP